MKLFLQLLHVLHGRNGTLLVEEEWHLAVTLNWSSGVVQGILTLWVPVQA